MDNDYADSYRLLYERHWWWRSREKYLLQWLEQLIVSPDPDACVLDVGCGDGLFFEKLNRYGHVYGLEVDPKLVSSGNEYASAIHIGPLDETYQPNRTYRLITMLDVIEHMPDPQRSLKRAVELLEPDGLLVATVPAFLSIWTNHDVLNWHQTRYDKHSFTELATQCGLRVDESRYFFCWLYPVKRLVRLKERLFPTKPDLPTIPSSIVNVPMQWLCRAEQWLLTQRDPKRGSSLFVVARKVESPRLTTS